MNRLLGTPIEASARRRAPPRRARPRPTTRSQKAPRPSPQPRSETILRLDHLRILVIEDHADTRTLLRQMLEDLGAQVGLAADGHEALHVLETEMPQPPHVILCDLLMPGMDGLAFAARLRGNPKWAGIPIVAVTALGGVADYIRTWAHGFAGHLVKPIDQAQLAETTRRVIRRPSRRRQRGPGPGA